MRSRFGSLPGSSNTGSLIITLGRLCPPSWTCLIGWWKRKKKACAYRRASSRASAPVPAGKSPESSLLTSCQYAS